MAHDFFCTECGQLNNADTVLFNMEGLITQQKLSRGRGLSILRLRLTREELEALLESGTPADDGFCSLQLSFPELMYLFSRENSMNDPSIATLRMEEILAFLYGSGQQETKKVYEPMADGDEERIDFFSEEPSKTVKKQAVREAVYPAGIEAMLAGSRINEDRAVDISMLKADLEKVAALFGYSEENPYRFRLKGNVQTDDRGETVLDGYWINGTPVEEARLCSRCMKPIFKHAGCAEHRVVSFIGETAAGKTSTILALTHYAKYGIHPSGTGSREEMIWTANPNMEEPEGETQVFTELLTENPVLDGDMEWYSLGVAPKKTEAGSREDAYHSTMMITNTGDHPKKMILTLLDLPGELFNGGAIDKEKIYNQFAAALSSQAFIICFDTRTVTMQKITNLINFSGQMQQMCLERSGGKYYVPSMILFTMSDEKPERLAARTSSAANLYLLRDEKRFLENTEEPIHRIYKDVCRLFSMGSLKNSYFSVLRCGAFGKSVPSTGEIRSEGLFARKELPDKAGVLAAFAKKKQMDPEDCRPSPNQVDLLMNWILRVSGCVACEAQYRTKGDDGSYRIKAKLSGYQTKMQYRAENPENVEQAMLRCYLFGNPGLWDLKLVNSLNENESSILTKLFSASVKDSTPYVMKQMKEQPDTNAAGE